MNALFPAIVPVSAIIFIGILAGRFLYLGFAEKVIRQIMLLNAR